MVSAVFAKVFARWAEICRGFGSNWRLAEQVSPDFSSKSLSRVKPWRYAMETTGDRLLDGAASGSTLC
jgi:hypothetical protein